MKRNWYGKCFSLLLALGLLGGCLPVSVQAGKTLTVWIPKTEEKLLAEGFHAFEEENPEVELERIVYSGMDTNQEMEKIQEQLQRGQGPDLVIFPSFGFQDPYLLMKNQVFAPLNSFMEADEDWDLGDYVENVLDAGVMDGTQYVMPLLYQFPSLLTTEGRLEDMGKEKEDFSDTLTILRNMLVLRSQEGDARILASGGFLFPLYLGGSFADYSSGEIGIDQNLLKRALYAYRAIYEEDFSVTSVDHFLCDYGKMIGRGEAYFYVPPSTEEMIGNAMGAALTDTPVILPFYTENGETTAEVNLYAGIRSGSSCKEEAWELLTCLMAENAQASLAEGKGNLPVSKEALETVFPKKQLKVKERLTGKELGDLPWDFLEDYQELVSHPSRAVFISHLCIQDFFVEMLPFLEGEAGCGESFSDFEQYAETYITG